MPALHERYLPVPYQPTKVDVSGDWRLAGRNFTIFSAQTDTVEPALHGDLPGRRSHTGVAAGPVGHRQPAPAGRGAEH